MKAKITTRQIKELHPIIYFGYCEIQYLLQCEEVIYYNAWIYGRNCDIYKIELNWHNIHICTWYRTPWNINEIKYHITQYYENKSKEENKNIYDRREKRTNNRKLLAEMLGNYSERFSYLLDNLQ